MGGVEGPRDDFWLDKFLAYGTGASGDCGMLLNLAECFLFF